MYLSNKELGIKASYVNIDHVSAIRILAGSDQMLSTNT